MLLLHGIISAGTILTSYLLRRKNNQDWRRSARWKKARRECIKRHNRRCAVTGKRWALMDVHHLEDASSRPHLRYSQKNLILVKRSIHKKFHIKFMGGYDKKCTKRDWNRFMKTYGKENIGWVEAITIQLEMIATGFALIGTIAIHYF